MPKFEYHQDYDLIIPGKSWIFINPTIGCPLECAYCVEQKDSWFEKKLKKIYNSSETIENIFDSPLILKDKTPLTFYNFSDPFLPKNKEGLMTILEELDKENWNNKVGLISKIHPGKEYLKRIKKIQNLKIGLFVSYSNLIQGLESISYEQRIILMKDAKNQGIKVVDYVRPLVKEWVSHENLSNLAHQIKGNVDAVSLSGIRLTPEIVESLRIKGIQIPEIKTYTNKQRDNNLSLITTEIIKNIAQVPVFWHTSCAMSYLFEEPDYNSHDIRERRKKDTCSFPCVDYQRNICDSRPTKTSDKEIQNIIERLGKKIFYRRENETILLSGPQLNKEDISFVRHVLPEFVMKDD